MENKETSQDTAQTVADTTMQLQQPVQSIQPSPEELRAEMLTQVGMGESVADVARAYNIPEHQIYKWIMEARQHQLKAQAPKQPAHPQYVPAQPPTLTQPQQGGWRSTLGAPQTTAPSYDDQMMKLTMDFLTKLKEILKRQILESIRGI